MQHCSRTKTAQTTVTLHSLASRNTLCCQTRYVSCTHGDESPSRSRASADSRSWQETAGNGHDSPTALSNSTRAQDGRAYRLRLEIPFRFKCLDRSVRADCVLCWRTIASIITRVSFGASELVVLALQFSTVDGDAFLLWLIL